ncbi:DsbE family thiol:disulfide interchange protein [Roseomonas terrae]|jgi:cytochrome c biogenesis protein CcmG/thiol:disulfide interchange protein DsbE|uniref:DsbE family thiol:disulfide interchange protein n=1 Tax=Neoroseomonas terrae TaxID=424799 RepID=A0ABS5EE14_9PROT|nr:DsbE family thiol:disulfide interchange protein [Neoroseomonas terrae]MBR0649260.1 DsbE family thiol:disulfide interchange protein [Neoroseomonas terrae]
MSDAPAPRSRRWMLYTPLALAGAAGAGFWVMLRGLQTGDYDPRGVPSALIGRGVPEFSLPAVEGSDRPALSAADLRGPLPRPVLVNFWASWCVPCIVEHPQLMALSREGVPVLGINYKDKPEDALAFLARRGDPYTRLGRDEPGRVAIDWGLYGVPETYLIDRQGIIRWRYAGPVTPEVVAQDLRPLLRRYA